MKYPRALIAVRPQRAAPSPLRRRAARAARLHALLLGLVVCAVAPAAFAQRGTGAEVYHRDGARFALEGRLDEAARAFEQAVKLDPTNGNAFYGLGNVYAELGRWEDACLAYYKAISLNKEDVEAYNNLGVALGMRGLHKQAAAAFERASKIYPKWAEPYYHLGEARRALGEEEEAREAFDKAIRLRPDYAKRPPRPFVAARTKPPAAPPRGGVLEAMNAVNLGAAGAETTAPTPTPSTASTTARPAPPAGPAAAPSPTPSAPTPARDAADSTSTPYDLGVREARAGRHREAVAAFRQAVLLDRKNVAAHRALGDAYAELGDWRNSVDAYEQAARLAPDNAEIYQSLGRAYTKLRETASEPARTEAAPARPATPDDAAAVAARAVPDDPDPSAVYRVGPGDVLEVRLLKGRERRSSAYEVAPTGLLDYPALRQPLAVAGLTPEEVAARVGAALGLRAGGADPEVAVGVRDYVSHAVIVGGMVKEGGTKILQREGVPLYVIVAHAQPLPGAGQALVVARATGRTTAVDLSDAASMKMLVRPGDVITVRALPKQFVYVAGAVREAGQKEFHTGMTLTQVLLAAGGVQAPGSAFAVVTRQGDDGRLSTARYNLAEIRAGRTPDPTLRPGDRVEVLR
ncbi:MAG TPA: tetratricopeptide repeat protein [Pyrinomonadaceae bacterium]|jgi:tetratricopeptide (TPR) repeat protein|nr:tetratricopeptide repeat protein [Pyrinomonadaceae bacterium]